MYAKLFERRRGVQSAYDGGGGGGGAVRLRRGGGGGCQRWFLALHPSVPSPLADKSLIFLDFRNEAPDCLSRFDICRNLTC